MTVDIQFFWKIFTAVGASIVTIAGIWRALKEIRSNTTQAKEEARKKEEKEKALTIIAGHLPMIEEYSTSAQEQALLKNGMLALLRFRINHLIRCIRENGCMTIDEKFDLKDLYEAYEGLGGNSRTHDLYDDTIKRYPVKDSL